MQSSPVDFTPHWEALCKSPPPEPAARPKMKITTLIQIRKKLETRNDWTAPELLANSHRDHDIERAKNALRRLADDGEVLSSTIDGRVMYRCRA
jgi:hypothetical protein